MYRAQILLERWQHEALKSMSERLGKSISQILRELIDDRLGSKSEKKKRGLSALEGLGSDRRASGRDHDRWLYGPTKRR